MQLRVERIADVLVKVCKRGRTRVSNKPPRYGLRGSCSQSRAMSMLVELRRVDEGRKGVRRLAHPSLETHAGPCCVSASPSDALQSTPARAALPPTSKLRRMANPRDPCTRAPFEPRRSASDHATASSGSNPTFQDTYYQAVIRDALLTLTVDAKARVRPGGE